MSSLAVLVRDFPFAHSRKGLLLVIYCSSRPNVMPVLMFVQGVCSVETGYAPGKCEGYCIKACSHTMVVR